MEFIGSAGWPAPRLHDASLSSVEMEAAYVQTCVALRAMFSRCKLVHGDLSKGWRGWRAMIDERAEFLQLLRKGVSFMMNRELAKLSLIHI